MSVYVVFLFEVLLWCVEFKVVKMEMFECFCCVVNVVLLMYVLLKFIDDVLKCVWDDCGLFVMFVFVVVGGYGCGEFVFYFDVDIFVLLLDVYDVVFDVCIECFIGMVWDFGFEIGSSVCMVVQCIEEVLQDVMVQILLLEVCCIVGSIVLFECFIVCYYEVFDVCVFFIVKVLEMCQCYVKFQDMLYSFELNVKESLGGLCDLQMILWIVCVVGFGSSWCEFDMCGLIIDCEVCELCCNEGFLKMLCVWLYVIVGCCQDMFVFDFQMQVVESFGYQLMQVKWVSEQLMCCYYWVVKVVMQFVMILIQNIEVQLFFVMSGIMCVLLVDCFVEKQGMFEIVDDGVFECYFDVIFEVFLLYEMMCGVKGLFVCMLCVLYNLCEIMNNVWCCDLWNCDMFMWILQQFEGIMYVFWLMNQMSVFGCYLLNFCCIVGQMQYDLYYVYMVDQYILMVLCNICCFVVVEYVYEYLFCSQLIGNFECLWVLYVVVLFYDIVKGCGGDYLMFGMVDVWCFCCEYGIVGDDVVLIVWFVQYYLMMSQVVQKQDMSDFEVIKCFVEVVGNEWYFIVFYLLIVVDICGMSLKVWNMWKGKLFEDLYCIMFVVFGGVNFDVYLELKL